MCFINVTLNVILFVIRLRSKELTCLAYTCVILIDTTLVILVQMRNKHLHFERALACSFACFALSNRQ